MHLRRIICIVICFIVVILAGTGCAYLKKDVVQVPCVIADSLTYTINIAPIIQNNCYDCHSAASNVSGILLDNYNGLKFYAQNGYLYGNISHASGYRAMPEGRNKLNDCTIATIKKWIDNGTLQ